MVDPAFDWEGDAPPRTPLADTVFYEVHVRGFTQQMEEVPPGLRGTFAGLACERAIDHLRRLGVTAVELLPVQAFNDERRLIDLGLANYWGYNTVGFFAPEPRYCAAGDPNDFRRMVKALHRAGIEVILDVVYNHTCEGNHLGPTLCFKGIDNPAYYRLTEDRRHYLDFTGTGNTVDASHPATLRLIMDSLRYWVRGNARRRLPLRPGTGDRPQRRRRLRAALAVPQRGRAGPGAAAGQADRRALGHRRRRLPGRRLPAGLVGMERPLPRHRARLLARHRRQPARIRGAPVRLGRHLRPRRGAGPAPAST